MLLLIRRRSNAHTCIYTCTGWCRETGKFVKTEIEIRQNVLFYLVVFDDDVENTGKSTIIKIQTSILSFTDFSHTHTRQVVSVETSSVGDVGELGRCWNFLTGVVLTTVNGPQRRRSRGRSFVEIKYRAYCTSPARLGCSRLCVSAFKSKKAENFVLTTRLLQTPVPTNANRTELVTPLRCTALYTYGHCAYGRIVRRRQAMSAKRDNESG